MEASRRTGWVRTQTPDSGALVPTTGAVQGRQGAAGLVMTFVQTRSAHWYIGPAATLPAPARQLRSPVMERPRNHTAPVPALTTTLIYNWAFLWITMQCPSPGLHFVVTSPPGPFRCVHMVRLCVGSPGLDWMDRLSWHQLIVVTRSLSPAQQPRCCCTLP